MQTFRVIELGTECVDKATGLTGTLTHWSMNMDAKIEYLFQPKGLDEDGQPLSKTYACQSRLNVPESAFEEVSVPFEILGTQVTDKASGFTGMATDFIRHINGCFHVCIQPKGFKKDGSLIKYNDFDLRSCIGEKIIQLSKDEHKNSQQQTPSPCMIPEKPLFT